MRREYGVRSPSRCHQRAEDGHLQVDHAFVAITREDVDRTLSYSTTYSLVDSDDNPIEDSSIQRETEEVTVTLNVLSTKEVPLDVTIIDGGGERATPTPALTLNRRRSCSAGECLCHRQHDEAHSRHDQSFELRHGLLRHLHHHPAERHREYEPALPRQRCKHPSRALPRSPSP